MGRAEPRLGAQRMVRELLEHEVTDFLGRDHDCRGPRRIRGYRNGYKPKTPRPWPASYRSRYSRPGTAEPFHSRLLRFLADPAQQDMLQRLVTEMYARGLSSRGIEGAFTDATGTRVLTKSPGSTLTQTLWTDFAAFQARDLRDFALEYLFLDAVFEPMRRTGHTREGVLAARGSCRGGQRVLLHLALGNSESADHGPAFQRDLVRWGLRALPISDGCARRHPDDTALGHQSASTRSQALRGTVV